MAPRTKIARLRYAAPGEVEEIYPLDSKGKHIDANSKFPHARRIRRKKEEMNKNPVPPVVPLQYADVHTETLPLQELNIDLETYVPDAPTINDDDPYELPLEGLVQDDQVADDYSFNFFNQIDLNNFDLSEGF